MIMDHANNKLIVAYAGSTVATNINSIYAYDFDDSTGVILTRKAFMMPHFIRAPIHFFSLEFPRWP